MVMCPNATRSDGSSSAQHNRLDDTVLQLKANALYYLDIAEHLRKLRQLLSPDAVPSKQELEAICEALRDAGTDHGGGDDDASTGWATGPGHLAAGILDGTFFFHADKCYDRTDEISMEQYHIAIGEEQPAPEPSPEQRKAYNDALLPYLDRLCEAFEPTQTIFREMHTAG